MIENEESILKAIERVSVKKRNIRASSTTSYSNTSERYNNRLNEYDETLDFKKYIQKSKDTKVNQGIGNEYMVKSQKAFESIQQPSL